VKKTKKLVIGASLVIALVASIAVAGCGGPAEPEVNIFKVGHSAPLSGPYASWGLSEQVGMEVQIDMLNADGGFTVDGKTYMMELALYDNQGDPAVQLSLARRIIDDGIGYVHTTYEAETIASNDLFNANKIVNIAACAGDDTLGPQWPYTFKIWFANQDGQEVLFEYLLTIAPDKKDVVTLHSDEAGGRTSAREVHEACALTGMNHAAELYYPADATEFRAVLADIDEMDVDYIELGTCPPPAYSLIIKQGKELGLDVEYLSTDSIDIGTLEEVVGWEGMQGVYGVPAAEVLPTAMGQEWNIEFIKRYGSPYGSQAIHGDGNVWMLTEALHQAGTFEPDPVVDVLEDLVMDLSYGPTWWRPFKPGMEKRVVCTACPVIRIEGEQMVDVHSAVSPRWR
jgi:ABC-type branched-subunit amino acid transport system substrate-binding protein